MTSPLPFYWNPSSGFLIHDLEKAMFTCGQLLSYPAKEHHMNINVNLTCLAQSVEHWLVVRKLLGSNLARTSYKNLTDEQLCWSYIKKAVLTCGQLLSYPTKEHHMHINVNLICLLLNHFTPGHPVSRICSAVLIWRRAVGRVWGASVLFGVDWCIPRLFL